MDEETEQSPEAEARLNDWQEVLAGVMVHVANEHIVLARMEEFVFPRPAHLAPSKFESEQLQSRTNQVVGLLGGSPLGRQLIIRANDCSDKTSVARYDEYPAAAMAEVVNMYHRTRRSVC
jgi:hypothetical protein